MKKVIMTVCLMFFFIASAFNGYSIYADDFSYEKIHNLITDKEDKLVLATIMGKGPEAYEVEVIDEIGDSDEIKNNGDQSPPYSIDVDIFENYMYFEEYSSRPKMGDNVLLSLTPSGNKYTVKNGAFKIYLADKSELLFEVPENQTESVFDELSALYLYVKSDGKRENITVENGRLYETGADGTKSEITDLEGFEMRSVDEYGETTGDTISEKKEKELINLSTKHRRLIAIAIIFVGLILGGVVVRLVSGSEFKRQG